MQKAGLDQKVSEELAEAIKETQNQSIEGLATKQDIKEIKQEMELMKKDIIIKLGSLLAIGIGIIAALIKL
jgi:hypothetical protein